MACAPGLAASQFSRNAWPCGQPQFWRWDSSPIPSSPRIDYNVFRSPTGLRVQNRTPDISFLSLRSSESPITSMAPHAGRVIATTHANRYALQRGLRSAVPAANTATTNHLRQEISATRAHRLWQRDTVDGLALIAADFALFVERRRRRLAQWTCRRPIRFEPDREVVQDGRLGNRFRP